MNSLSSVKRRVFIVSCLGVLTVLSGVVYASTYVAEPAQIQHLKDQEVGLKEKLQALNSDHYQVDVSEAVDRLEKESNTHATFETQFRALIDRTLLATFERITPDMTEADFGREAGQLIEALGEDFAYQIYIRAFEFQPFAVKSGVKVEVANVGYNITSDQFFMRFVVTTDVDGQIPFYIKGAYDGVTDTLKYVDVATNELDGGGFKRDTFHDAHE